MMAKEELSNPQLYQVGSPPLPEYLIVKTYQYDGQGNLIRQNPSNYDHKLNLQQLHPFWQFIARDYSLNNPIAAVHYNNFGLPDYKFALPVWNSPFLGNSLICTEYFRKRLMNVSSV